MSQIHIYTGEGKGKTTAAIGLAIRAYGAGFHVLFLQFMKSISYHEISVLEKMGPALVVQRFGNGCIFNRDINNEDREEASKGWECASQAIQSKKYQLIILDELNIALHLKLLPLQPILSVLRARPQDCEVVITGRHAPEPLLKEATLITRMINEKHYYDQGVLARDGIER